MKSILLILTAVVLCGCEAKVYVESKALMVTNNNANLVTNCVLLHYEKPVVVMDPEERKWKTKCTDRANWKIITDGEVFRILYPTGDMTVEDFKTGEEAEKHIQWCINYYKKQLREWKEVQ